MVAQRGNVSNPVTLNNNPLGKKCAIFRHRIRLTQQVGESVFLLMLLMAFHLIQELSFSVEN